MLSEDFVSGVVSVARFPQQCSCNIPSERTCMGHPGADLCQWPPRGINHSLRSLLAIDVSALEKKKCQDCLQARSYRERSAMEKQKLKIHQICLAERTWRLSSCAHFENIPVTKARAHVKGNTQSHRQGYNCMGYSVEKFPLSLWNPDKVI